MSNPGTTPPPSPNYIHNLMNQVDDAADIMKTNVNKIMDRDENLQELGQRADHLHEGAALFQQQFENKVWHTFRSWTTR